MSLKNSISFRWQMLLTLSVDPDAMDGHNTGIAKVVISGRFVSHLHCFDVRHPLRHPEISIGRAGPETR